MVEAKERKGKKAVTGKVTATTRDYQVIRYSGNQVEAKKQRSKEAKKQTPKPQTSRRMQTRHRHRVDRAEEEEEEEEYLRT